MCGVPSVRAMTRHPDSGAPGEQPRAQNTFDKGRGYSTVKVGDKGRRCGLVGDRGRR